MDPKGEFAARKHLRLFWILGKARANNQCSRNGFRDKCRLVEMDVISKVKIKKDSAISKDDMRVPMDF